MALDTRLPLQVKQATIAPFQDYLTKGLEARDLLDQRRLRDVQLANANAETEMRKTQQKTADLGLKKAERADTFDQAASKAAEGAFKMGEKGEYVFDDDTYYAELAKAGFPKEAQEYRNASETDKLNREKARRLDLEASLKEASAQHKALASVWTPLMRPDVKPEQRAEMYQAAVRQSKKNPYFKDFELEDTYTQGKSDFKIQQIIDTADDDPYDTWVKASEQKRKDEDETAKLEEQKYKTKISQSAYYARIFGAAKSQEDWDRALKEIGPEAAKDLPTQFSEETRKAMLQRGVDPKDQLKPDTNTNIEELVLKASGTGPEAEIAKKALNLLKQYNIDINNAKKPDTGLSFDPGTGEAVNENGFDDTALEGVDSGLANQVKALVRGDAPYPIGTALRDPRMKQVLELAYKYEPGFSKLRYDQRASTVKSFSGQGQDSNNKKAINTIIGHLYDMDTNSKSLNNFDTQILNSVKNWLLDQTGSDRLEGFKRDVDAVSGEFSKLIKGGMATQSELDHFKESLTTSDSPAQIKKNINETINLMASRAKSLRETYWEGMGHHYDMLIIDPERRSQLDAVAGPGTAVGIDPDLRAPVLMGQKAGGPAPTTPAKPAVKKGPSEDDIKAVMRANKGATREEAIEALEMQRGQ